MFLDLHKVLLALLYLSASCGATSPSLSVIVTGARDMDSAENLKVLVSLVNDGSDAINVLNHPQGPLSKLPTNTFAITDSKDARIEPQFMGIRLKYAQEKAAKAGDYTTLAPGEVVTMEHYLSEAYNFTFRGSGKHEYHIAPKDIFYVVTSPGANSTDTPKITPITAKVTAHLANISSSIPPLRKSHLSRRKPSYANCTQNQQISLTNAALVAQAYVSGAKAFASSLTASTNSSRYKTWFGAWSASRHKTVVEQYTAISANNFSTYTFDCSCAEQNTFAYVYPDEYGHMYLCGAFWDAPLNGTDSKASADSSPPFKLC
ncbi:hypothetical protein D9619_007946 [Psilocybe cf. subviscida]|uniref:Lysine-specific metallo-endopeptidase domain-containing protein n=1 Tax=Psilocybe cf. subviscida TaxID=2480587 RepID=A0A8H5AU53_9AGAR|nr:hypothetical protein D9619_007946 [Psilocybe cf. subviscida]